MANKKEDYLFLSALLRAREAKMLTRERAERMLDAPSYGEAAKMLTDCGYKDYSDLSAKEVEQALNQRRAADFEEMARMTPNKLLVDVFRMKYDYHNGQELPMVVGESGRSTFELIRQRGSLRRSGGMMGWPARSHSITTEKTLE